MDRRAVQLSVAQLRPGGYVGVSVTVAGRMTGMDLWLQLVLNAVVTSLLGWLFSIYGFLFPSAAGRAGGGRICEGSELCGASDA